MPNGTNAGLTNYTMTAQPVNIAPVRWFGGKGPMKAKLLPLIPSTRTYVEPFGGGGSVLFARKPSPVEVYNDLDGRLVNLFRVLQDVRLRRKLYERLRYTLYSRAEYADAMAKQSDPNPVTGAWAFFVVQAMCIGGLEKTGWSYVVRSSSKGMASNASKFLSRIDLFDKWADRLRHVQIEQRPAKRVLEVYDSTETTFYVDPPYVSDTRTSGVYRHEMTGPEHQTLVTQLLGLSGAVVVSGYIHPIYEPLTAAGWDRLDFAVNVHAAAADLQNRTGKRDQQRIECVWRNPKAISLLNQPVLFG